MNKYTHEALINLSEKKGLMDKEELLGEIKRLRRAQTKAYEYHSMVPSRKCDF